ncbi:MAG TPA: ABC transporter permease, partial [Paenirhodobacter sp.]
MPKSNLVYVLLLQRLGIAVVTLIVVSVAVFFATEMLPGDVAQILLGQAATPEAVAGLRQAMGLDQPAL